VVGGSSVIGYGSIVIVPKIFNIDPKLVKVIGDPKGQKLIIVPIQRQMVRKGEPCALLSGLPVAVIVQQYPHPRFLAYPGIGSEGLGIRSILNAHPLRKSVDTYLDMIANSRIGGGHYKGVVCQILGMLGNGKFLPHGGQGI
jgi:hypothetical protein